MQSVEINTFDQEQAAKQEWLGSDGAKVAGHQLAKRLYNRNVFPTIESAMETIAIATIGGNVTAGATNYTRKS